MNTIDNIKERFNELQSGSNGKLKSLEQSAFEAFNRMGIPTAKHEEWKYTRIGSLFSKEFVLKPGGTAITLKEVEAVRLPGHEEANELFFINGFYSTGLSTIRSKELIVQSLQEAAVNEYAGFVAKHLGHSNRYAKDGIHAMNSAFVHEGVFIHIGEGKIAEHPVYIYYITDAAKPIYYRYQGILYTSGSVQKLK
jgi:Fe-S cluster assembly protein SufD